MMGHDESIRISGMGQSLFLGRLGAFDGQQADRERKSCVYCLLCAEPSLYPYRYIHTHIHIYTYIFIQ